MHPPLSSSQSPLSSVSACGENCARSLAPPLPTARGAAGAPLRDIKKKMRRARWKRKNVSAGRSAQAQTSCRRRGKVGNPARRSETENARPLGKPSARGSLGYIQLLFSLPLAGQLMRVSSRANATASTTARAARSEAERAEREAGQMRFCTPTPSAPSATGRQYRPHRRPKRARRQGQIGAGTDPPTPSRGGPLHRSASKRSFLLDRARPVFFSAKTEKKMGGCIPAGQALWREPAPPRPPSGGPYRSRQTSSSSDRS